MGKGVEAVTSRVTLTVNYRLGTVSILKSHSYAIAEFLVLHTLPLSSNKQGWLRVSDLGTGGKVDV